MKSKQERIDEAWQEYRANINLIWDVYTSKRELIWEKHDAKIKEIQNEKNNKKDRK